MADDKTVAASRKAAVSNEGNILTQAPAHDCARRAQHFTHAGRAFRALIADDDYITGNYRTVQDGLQGLLLGLIQGLTEFLPVSSSGHLVLMRTLFGIEIARRHGG